MAKLILFLALACVAYVSAYPSPQDFVQSLPGRVKRAPSPIAQFFGFNTHDHFHPGPGHYGHGGFFGGHSHGGHGHWDQHFPYGDFGPSHYDWHPDYY